MESDIHNILTLVTVMLGVGLYLRIVGKEKHRRDRWLKYRLEESIKELAEEEETVLEPLSELNAAEQKEPEAGNAQKPSPPAEVQQDRSAA